MKKPWEGSQKAQGTTPSEIRTINCDFATNTPARPLGTLGNDNRELSMPRSADQPPDFARFLNDLPGKSLALVYSFSNTIDKDRVWYDRWKSSTIMYFGQGGHHTFEASMIHT